MYKLKIFNNIAASGLERLDSNKYQIIDDLSKSTSIVLRSHKLSEDNIPLSIDAIGRAGAGVNNIPVDAMSDRGVPVFNAPGANANAVKELTIASLLIAARNICTARDYVRSLDPQKIDIKKSVEAGKNNLQELSFLTNFRCSWSWVYWSKCCQHSTCAWYESCWF